jgi:hypothetical protein
MASIDGLAERCGRLLRTGVRRDADDDEGLAILKSLLRDYLAKPSGHESPVMELGNGV